MKRALEGIRVLDIGQVMAGPFCAMLLCDMGADVIKVEPPTGDSTRRMAGAVGTDSPSFNAVNRGKRSIVLNFKTDEGKNVLRRLVGTSDVIIENYRPGVMHRFGLDFTALSSLNPRLVYASISGYGQTGPSGPKGGFDLVAQGVSGLMSIMGEPERPPVKAGIPVTDLGAALFALSGILAALFNRNTTGCGQHIDTSLLEAGMALSVWEATEYFSGSGIPKPMGSAHRMIAPYQAVRCSDRYITLGTATDHLFRRLCILLERPEWADHPDYIDNTARVQNRSELTTKIESIMAQKSSEFWLSVLEEQDIPCGPINNYEEIMNDPQVKARQMIVYADHPTLGRIKMLGSPVKMSSTPLVPNRRSPLLAEHTDQVLKEIGFMPDEIDKLRQVGAIA